MNANLAKTGFSDHRQWVGVWAGAPSDVGLEFADQSLRVIVSPRFQVDQLRIGITNRFGTRSVAFSNASIGLQSTGAALVPGSHQRVTFGNSTSVTLAPRQEAISNAVRLPFRSFQNLKVSLHVAGVSGKATRHYAALQTSFIAPASAGDQTNNESESAFETTTTSSYFLSVVEVLAERNVGAIVTFGDSITDGFQGEDGIATNLDERAIDRNERYPDFLAIIIAGLDRGVSAARLAVRS